MKFEPILKEEAKKRSLANLKQNAGSTEVQNSAHREEKNKTRDEMAKIAGVSHDTIDRTKVILSEGSEEQIAAVRSGEKSINKVFREIRPSKQKSQEVKVNPEDSGAQKRKE